MDNWFESDGTLQQFVYPEFRPEEWLDVLGAFHKLL